MTRKTSEIPRGALRQNSDMVIADSKYARRKIGKAQGWFLARFIFFRCRVRLKVK